MRIVFVTATFYPEMQFGGAPQKIYELSRGLAASGHEVRVVTRHSAHPTACYATVTHGITVEHRGYPESYRQVRNRARGGDHAGAGVASAIWLRAPEAPVAELSWAHGGIAAGVERVLRDAALRRDLVARGLERAQAFTWAQAGDRLLEVYRDVRDSV